LKVVGGKIGIDVCVDSSWESVRGANPVRNSIPGLAIHPHHHRPISNDGCLTCVWSTSHLRLIAPEAVFSDGHRPSKVSIADIAGLYS
jgi:hypothetical protein